MTQSKPVKNRNKLNAFRVTILFLLLYGFHQSGNSQIASSISNSKATPCLSCDSLLVYYSESFLARDIDLGKSMSDSYSKFFTNTDTACLRSQQNYRYSILLVLSRLALYHLKCCNQGYDLFQMNGTATEKIVDEFLSISGISRDNTEMISSGYVLDFLTTDKVALSYPFIKEMLIEFQKEKKRIAKGID